MNQSNELIKGVNNHAAEPVQLMYYEEGDEKNFSIAAGHNEINVNIPLPESNSADEYAQSRYVTFRFPDNIFDAWVRVFLDGQIISFTTQENPDWEQRKQLAYLGEGMSFHVNYPILSFVAESARSIWIIGDIDTMPGHDPD